jgi:mono/diheme cytochrome c family protein
MRCAVGRVAWSIFVAVALVCLVDPAEALRADEPAAGFRQAVAPLLVRHCLACHNASERKGGLDLTTPDGLTTGGDSGPVVAAGDVDASLLWQRVAADEMPPEKPLDVADRELLREWIAAGAAWEGAEIDPFQFTTDARAGYDWWSLQAVVRPDPPPIEADASASGFAPRNEIDHFVLAELAAHGLRPSPEADRPALIRRLSFDLLGLPPTPEEVAAFVADERPDAYERLVDRLLESPHYGERWARHWLDIVRFGESQGFERDKLRTNAWPYRDWVITALNDDSPYDEFIRLQLAGDVLRPDDPLAVAATGFLTAGAYDEVGQTQQSLAMRAVVREDELEDITGVVGQTFLGLTVNCARCHDHKFDPVRQREYYQLTAALAGVRHGERDRLSEAGRAALAGELQALDGQIAELSARREALLAPVREHLLTGDRRTVVSPPTPIARWDFDVDLNDSIGGLHGTAHGGARLEEGRLILDGLESYVATEPLPTMLSAKTLEAWVALDDLSQQGGGAISVQSLDGATFDAIVFGEREPGQWMAGSNGFVRTQSFSGTAETEAAPALVHVAIVYQADGTIIGYRNGVPYGQPYPSSGLQRFGADQSQLLFGLRHAPPGGNRMLKGAIDRAALYNRALSAEEVAAAAGVAPATVSLDVLLAELSPEALRRYAELTRDISRIEVRRRLLAGGPTYLPVPTQPEVRHVLARGNPAQPGDVVVPGGVAAVDGSSRAAHSDSSASATTADFGLPPDAPEGERRARLAAWISNPANPLTARVMVNRLWQYHFGQGLVSTPNDFGFNGGRPTHPALLDWLASEFIARGWRLKDMHRLIVRSATYRQGSRFDPAAAAVDADNRWLWRKSPARLEAEALRDAVLSVAGELNPTLGGPGYQDFRTFTFNSQFYELIDPVGWQYNRRGIYRTLVRSGTNPLLDVLDCPDPSTTAPRRAVTTTPLQALALLNDSFMLRMADAFAARVAREAGQSIPDQIRRACLLAYSRDAAPDEIALAEPFIRDHGLPAFCRVLFNSNEFLYVD